MKKIMFNDKLGLTDRVLWGEKTQTRRIAFGKTFLRSDTDKEVQVTSLYEKDNMWFYIPEKSNDARQLNKRLYPKYKTGDVVAIAMSYKDCYFCCSDSCYSELKDTKGWLDKRVTKSYLMAEYIKIESVTAHRIQDITEEECEHEGLETIYLGGIGQRYIAGRHGEVVSYTSNPKLAYEYIFKKIYGKKMWDENPWVYAYKFHLCSKEKL